MPGGVTGARLTAAPYADQSVSPLPEHNRLVLPLPEIYAIVPECFLAETSCCLHYLLLSLNQSARNDFTCWPNCVECNSF